MSKRSQDEIVKEGKVESPKKVAALESEDGAPVKANGKSAEVNLPYNIVVVDIEGTTTPISFVHDVLFPYVTNHVEDFLKEKWGNLELEEKVEALRTQAEKDIAENVKDAVAILPKDHADVKAVRDSVTANIRWQVKADRKIGALKSFQGFMWRFAYESGKVKGSVFDDVLPVMKQWKSHGFKLYVYSSGSIEAQKLLFGYSDKGDLLHYFSGHFDTTIGSKLEVSSYTKIASSILPPSASSSSILFLSDNPLEIAAAKAVGYKVAVLSRPGNAALDLADTENGVKLAYVPDLSENGKGAKIKVPVIETFDQAVEGDAVNAL